jgi:hypothetical protein
MKSELCYNMKRRYGFSLSISWMTLIHTQGWRFSLRTRHLFPLDLALLYTGHKNCFFFCSSSWRSFPFFPFNSSEKSPSCSPYQRPRQGSISWTLPMPLIGLLQSKLAQALRSQISARALTILTGVFHDFHQSPRRMAGYYLKLGHD